MVNRDYFKSVVNWDGTSEYPPGYEHMDTAPGFEAAPGVTLRPFFGKRLMMSHVTFLPGAEAPLHQHPEEQLTFVISGRLEFTVGHTTRWLEPGDILSIPSMVPHKAVAGDTGCVEVDMFAPPREGFRALMADVHPEAPPKS
jgi:quercetin dioxygenase-like cupin family protein